MDDLVRGEKYRVPGINQPWHSDCELEYHFLGKEGVRRFWCINHNQWAYQFPTRTLYEHELVEHLSKD